MLPGITDEVKKETDPTNEQSIHHVRPWQSRFSIENLPKGSTPREIGRIAKKLKRTSTIAERSWSAYLNDEQYQKRMHTRSYTQSDMEYFDRKALERKNYVATPEETVTPETRDQTH